MQSKYQLNADYMSTSTNQREIAPSPATGRMIQNHSNVHPKDYYRETNDMVWIRKGQGNSSSPDAGATGM